MVSAIGNDGPLYGTLNNPEIKVYGHPWCMRGRRSMEDTKK